MAANPALWADILRDLGAALTNVRDLAERARSLEERGAAMPADIRLDREIAIGSMLHNCYGAMESALERLVTSVDGSLPTGRSYHAEPIRRAAAPVPGVRPAMISSRLAADLQRLRQFRHTFRNAYGGYDYARAAENVPIATRAAEEFEAEVSAFAAAIGLIETPALGQERDSAT